MDLMQLVYTISFFSVVIAFAYAVYLHFWVKRQPAANKRIIEVSDLIHAGANTFMRKEYIILARFAGVAAVLILVFLPSPIWDGNIMDNLSMINGLTVESEFWWRLRPIPELRKARRGA